MSIWILKSFWILSNLKRLLSTFAMGISTMERLRFNRIYDDHCTVKINIESAIKLSSMSESTVELVSLTWARNDDFRLNVLKTLFRLPRVFLDLNKCILSGALKCLFDHLLRATWVSTNYKCFSLAFPKILDAIWEGMSVNIDQRSAKAKNRKFSEKFTK